MDDKVELGEKFELSCLTVRENFGSGGILQILIVYNNIYR